jgi:hypothetical protein
VRPLQRIDLVRARRCVRCQAQTHADMATESDRDKKRRGGIGSDEQRRLRGWSISVEEGSLKSINCYWCAPLVCRKWWRYVTICLPT